MFIFLNKVHFTFLVLYKQFCFKNENIHLSCVSFEYKSRSRLFKMYKVYSRTWFPILAISFCIKLYKDRQLQILKDCEMEKKKLVFAQSPVKFFYNFSTV